MLQHLFPRRFRTWIRQFDPGFNRLLAEIQVRDRRLEEVEQRLCIEIPIRDKRIEQLQAEIWAHEQQMDARITTVLENVVDNGFIARRIAPHRKHLWLVAAPKSGSTWLTRLLTHLLGWESNCLVNHWDRREQEVDLRWMLQHPDRNLFSVQQHCRFSEPTRDFIERFRVRVVLQGRDLFDTIVSIRDHLVKESPATPVGYVDESFRSLSEDRQFDLLVDLAVPWYLNFYVSWFAARQRGDVDFLWVNYESLLGDRPATLRRILDYVGEQRTDAEFETAQQRTGASQTRFNVGRTGRGEKTLSDEHKRRIRRLRDFYPDIDLTAVGL